MCSLINLSTLLSCGYRRRTKSIKGDSSNPSTRLGDEGCDCVSEDGTLTCFLRCFDCCLMPSFRDWSVKLFMFFSLFTRKVFSSSYCSTFSTSPYMLWISWSKAGSGRTLLREGMCTRHVGHSFFPILMHLSMHSSQNLCRHSFTIRAFFIYPRQIAQWNSELRTLRGSLTLFSASAVSVRGARWISNKVKSGIWVNSSHLDLGLKSTCLLFMDVLRGGFELMIRWKCCPWGDYKRVYHDLLRERIHNNPKRATTNKRNTQTAHVLALCCARRVHKAQGKHKERCEKKASPGTTTFDTQFCEDRIAYSSVHHT